MNIAKLIYENYPNSDLLDIDPEKDCVDLETLYRKVTTNDACTFGDSLFKFIVVEVYEGACGSTNDAIRVLNNGLDDIQSVINALEKARNK